MSGAALALVLTSAVMHAGWNLLAKGSRGGVTFFWVTILASLLIYLPAFIVLLVLNPIPPAGWAWIAATGALHTAYFWSLAQAYERADLSVAYPIARGLGPALVLLASVTILQEPVSASGVVGVVAVVLGIYALNLRGLRPAEWLRPVLALVRHEGRYAVLTGVLIATYTLVDKRGVSVVHPFVYVYLMFALAGVGLSVLVVFRRSSLPWREVDLRSWRVFAVAVLWLAAYLMVLIALRQSPAPYVAAAREISIVFAAVLGVIVLREPRRLHRFVGALGVAAGVILIGLA